MASPSKDNRHRSLPNRNIFDEGGMALKKDTARYEMAKRADWEEQNLMLNRHVSQKDPLVMVPDDSMQILDMMPRLDIIEDQFFRKSIPKSTKLFKLKKNFSDVNDNTPLTKFMSAIIKENL